MYAIVRCGGRQEKVALDDVVTVDKLPGEAGSSITLPAVLVVDGDRVISDPAEVSRYQVTADIVGAATGPKINMIQYRNKTGYRRRLGHRQHYTQVRITGIAPQAKSQSKPESKPQSKPQSKPRAQSKTTQAKAAPKAEAAPKAAAKAKTTPKAEAAPKAQATPKAAAKAQAAAKAEEN